jgi:hypothetical protein
MEKLQREMVLDGTGGENLHCCDYLTEGEGWKDDFKRHTRAVELKVRDRTLQESGAGSAMCIVSTYMYR